MLPTFLRDICGDIHNFRMIYAQDSLLASSNEAWMNNTGKLFSAYSEYAACAAFNSTPCYSMNSELCVLRKVTVTVFNCLHDL